MSSQPTGAIDPAELWDLYLAETDSPSPQGAMAFASEFYAERIKILSYGTASVAFAMGWTDLKGVSLEEFARALKARVAQTEGALRAIMTATVEGRVCDDVAWFDGITTLHDFCDLVLNGPDAEAGS